MTDQRAAWRVRITRTAERSLETLPVALQGRLIRAMRTLAENPYGAGDKLRGAVNRWRLRVGEYRAVYIVDAAARVVTVTAIGHRGEIYRRL